MEKIYSEIYASLGRGNWRELAGDAGDILAARLTTLDEINAAMIDLLDWQDGDAATYVAWALIRRLKEIAD